MHNKVLVLEKSASCKYLLQKCLNDLGYECEIFRQPEQAAKAMQNNNYSLIITSDHFIAKSDLLSNYKGPTVVTSALFDKAPANMSLLAKPMTLETIYQVITAELGGSTPSLLAA